MVSEKDQATETLVKRHFEIDPGKTKILRFLSTCEGDPGEPIKLLEITNSTFETDEVQTFGFGPARDFEYSTVVAEVTPTEFRKIKRKEIPLPKGWNLRRVREYDRPTVPSAPSGK